MILPKCQDPQVYQHKTLKKLTRFLPTFNFSQTHRLAWNPVVFPIPTQIYNEGRMFCGKNFQKAALFHMKLTYFSP